MRFREVPVLRTERLLLTLPDASAAPLVLDYFERNRAHLGPWSPAPPPGFYTERFWRLALERNLDEWEHQASCRFKLLSPDGGRVLGDANITQIFRGPFQAAYLGYGLDGARTGEGLMREALEAVIDFAFGSLNLHRLMANYLPHNVASGGLLKRLGFQVEGYSRDYLRIGGRWQDHVLTALHNPAWQDETLPIEEA